MSAPTRTGGILLAASLIALLAFSLAQLHPDRSIANTAAAVSRRKIAASGSLPPARIDGIVTFFDPRDGLLFVQDATGGVRVSVGDDGARYSPGQRVAVSGVISDAELSPVILAPTIVVHGTGPLPAALPSSASAFGTREVENRLVAVEGVVQSAGVRQNGIAPLIEISQNGLLIEVTSQELAVQHGDEINRRVRVTGVATSGRNVELKPVGRSLLNASWASTVHLEPARPLGSAPLVTCAGVAAWPADRLPEHGVRLKGKLEAAGLAGAFRIHDGTGSLKVEFGFGGNPRLNEDIEVAGFVRRGAAGPYLASAIMLVDAHEQS